VVILTVLLPDPAALDVDARNALRAQRADAYRAETGTDADVGVDLLPVEDAAPVVC
jgi:hypothetical protein